MRRRLLVFLIAIGIAGPAIAQEGGDADPVRRTAEELAEELRNYMPPPIEDLALPESPADGGADAETRAAFQQTMRAYYDYRQRGYEHRMGVFEWQSFSTKLIFGVVLVLVFLGIYFAAIQFHIGLRRDGKPGPPAESEVTELVVSAKELKVRSPVLGVVVLALSLAFFYLYLVYVYPIETVF